MVIAPTSAIAPTTATATAAGTVIVPDRARTTDGTVVRRVRMAGRAIPAIDRAPRMGRVHPGHTATTAPTTDPMQAVRDPPVRPRRPVVARPAMTRSDPTAPTARPARTMSEGRGRTAARHVRWRRVDHPGVRRRAIDHRPEVHSRAPRGHGPPIPMDVSVRRDRDPRARRSGSADPGRLARWPSRRRPLSGRPRNSSPVGDRSRRPSWPAVRPSAC